MSSTAHSRQPLNPAAAPRTMRAVTARRYGGPDVLVVEHDVPVPIPAPGEILIRVNAAGVNPADANVRSGKLRAFTGWRAPRHTVLGLDVAGEVVADGDGFRAGERVVALLPPTRGGAYAEYAAVRATDLARVPAQVSTEDAAAIPCAALTADHALRTLGKVAAGDTVLVRGAGGGVGNYAVQLAHALGARVIAVCAADKAAWVRTLGADEVLDWGAFATAAPRGLAVLFDVRGGLPHHQARRLLTRTGLHVTVAPDPLGLLLSAATRILPGARYTQFLVRPDGPALQRLVDGAPHGVQSTRSTTLPLTQAVDAHRLIDTGHTKGKIVLSL